MFVKIFKTAVLIFGILWVVFSLSACDRMKAEIGFKWGKIQMSDPYREAKNSRKDIDPAVVMERPLKLEPAQRISKVPHDTFALRSNTEFFF